MVYFDIGTINSVHGVHKKPNIQILLVVLSSLPMFLLSFLEIPKGVKKRLDFFRLRFFWQSDGHKKKYRLSKWNIIYRPKTKGARH
jgi:hypothetical protein